MRLLLFDIDGTLIRGNKAGRKAMGAALAEMFGSAGALHSYNFSGKTDARIISDLLTGIGVGNDEISLRLPEVYALMASKAKEIYPQQSIIVCSGVQDLLAALRERQDVLLGLLTGNAEATSALKLEAAGIDPKQFVLGAYGSDDDDRNRLPALALQRAHKLTGLRLTGNNTTIIGDTPADILCARAGKARAVAVATGWHSLEELASCAPDGLFEDFADTQTVLRTLLSMEGGWTA